MMKDKSLTITKAANGYIVEIHIMPPITFEDQLKLGMQIAKDFQKDDQLGAILEDDDTTLDERQLQFSQPLHIFSKFTDMMNFVRDYYIWLRAT